MRVPEPMPKLSAAAAGLISRIIALNAGNGTQIFVDGSEIVVRHFLEAGPGHDLEQVSVEWMRNAARIWRSGAGRVKLIRIDPGANDVQKLVEGEPVGIPALSGVMLRETIS